MATQADARNTAPPQQDVPSSPAGDIATETARLPLNKLIGIVGAPDNRTAILREGDGEILSVKLGDQTAKGKVTAIGAGEILLARAGGKVHRLSLPD